MKIVFLDTMTLGNEIDLSILEQYGQLEQYQFTPAENTIERVKDADIIITNKVMIDKAVMDAATKLKLVCIAATGMNNVDLKYAEEKGIQVKNVQGYSTESVVQHTFAMLFMMMSSLGYYNQYVKSGEYFKSPVFTHLGEKITELHGKVFGIIGLGAIGKRVAEIAQVFGCKVIYYSTSGNNKSSHYERVGLDYLMSNADIISIHAPLNNDTLNLISEKELGLMKETAYILNLGRGKIIDEKALASHLKADKLAGVALDVLEQEPIQENSALKNVLDNPKLLITPHTAWATHEARIRLVKQIAKNIDVYISTQNT